MPAGFKVLQDHLKNLSSIKNKIENKDSRDCDMLSNSGLVLCLECSFEVKNAKNS